MTLTPCTCDPAWPAYAVCEPCALRRSLEARGVLRTEVAPALSDRGDREDVAYADACDYRMLMEMR